MQNAGRHSRAPPPSCTLAIPILYSVHSPLGVDKARRIASKYAEAGQSFRVKVKDLLHIFFTSLIIKKVENIILYISLRNIYILSKFITSLIKSFKYFMFRLCNIYILSL